MSTQTVVVESANLRAVATVNGRMRCPVFVYAADTPEVPLATDCFNPASAKEREKFLAAIGDIYPGLDIPGEVAPLLERLAVEVAAASVTGTRETTDAEATLDVEPWGESVAGADLLDAVAAHVRRYLYLPSETADAVAAWAVLTHCVDSLMFAPLLVISSASKRCGKTVLLSLLAPVVRRGRLTSANGVTSAVLFRLNEKQRPTLLLDEAEKLRGRHADPELLGMVNVGYRRGAKVYRCADSGGSFDIQEFDAFGFRALALIGTAWDTIADRGIVVPMGRKPRAVPVARFHESAVERAGRDFSRQARRWTTDCRDALRAAIDTAPRPDWLGDRDCDNWGALFAIAAVAGRDWPERIERAARTLAAEREDDGDDGERLVHDIRATFAMVSDPIVIQSGELLQRLNSIETSDWGDARDGRGLSTHALARRLKQFAVKPRLDRHPETAAVVRGYWRADFQSVFERYPAPVLAPDCNAVTVVTLRAADGPTVIANAEEGDPRASADDITVQCPAQSVTTVTGADDDYERDERAGMADG